MILLGGGVFKKCLGHKDKALMSGSSVLIKETSQRSLSPSTMWGLREKAPSIQQKVGPHRPQICQCLDLRLPILQNNEKCIPIVYKLSVSGIIIAAQTTKTVRNTRLKIFGCPSAKYFTLNSTQIVEKLEYKDKQTQ